jgi:acetylglutamate kinase
MIVVKFGGHAMTDQHGSFAAAIKSALSKGVQIVIVHGGGPQINAALESAGIKSDFIGGFRVTTPEIFEIVEQVLVTRSDPL